MGTRADFYIKSGRSLVKEDWVGSIAWDGYPDGISDAVKNAKTKEEFEMALAEFFKGRTDVTVPEVGWPWPWDTSATTDFAYIFNGKEVTWRGCKYPDMSSMKNVAIGSKRSGIMVFGGL